jgi:amidase
LKIAELATAPAAVSRKKPDLLQLFSKRPAMRLPKVRDVDQEERQMELWQSDATELASLIRTGQASAREAVDSVLARLDKVNPAVNAVVRVLEAEARTAADAADAARARGGALPPLHGVPVTTKVNVDQAGLPTDNGVVALKDFIAKEDSPVIANLKHAGAIVVGRTNAPAFAMRAFTDNALHGQTLNPRDPSVASGGSSGGAGVATATGIGAIAHANDIGGSVRIPAYCNGVVGLRTGFGRIPAFNPSMPRGLALSTMLMATQGPITRTVRDARLALAAMARGDRRDWRWSEVPMQGPPPAPPIKVAIVPDVPGGPTHPAQAAAVRQAGKHLQAAGYVVEEVLPPDMERGAALFHIICVTDLFGVLWPQMQKVGDPNAIASMKAWLDVHPPVDAPTFVAALAERERLVLRWMAFLEKWPLLVLPTLPDLPPKPARDAEPGGKREVLTLLRTTLLAPLLGLPGLAVPVGSHGKLRTGVQIMAMRNREDLCLDAGEVIETSEGAVMPIDPAPHSCSMTLPHQE